MSLDVNKVKEEALKEVEAEQLEEAKDRYKFKLEQLGKAKSVVKNLERELIDLEDELSND